MDDAIVEKDELCDELDPEPDVVRSPNRRPRRTLEEKCEWYLRQGFGVPRIARRTGVSERVIRPIIEAIEQQKIQEVLDSDEVTRARHISFYEMVIEESSVAYRESRRSKKRNLRLLRVGMEAQRYVGALRGLNAPTRTETHTMSAHLIVNRDMTQQMLADPKMQELTLQMEARARELGHQP